MSSRPTGTLTPATVEALNGRQPDQPTDIIIANMERWRWMPHDLGKTYVMVNLPEFTLRVYHDGKQVWMTKIVDGKPTMPTPIMSAEMKYITVNPTWNVPPSIVHNEYLPALQQDPTVLARMGLKVEQQPRRHRPHFAAARREQRARPASLQFPQQVPGLSARHAGQAPVRLGPAGVQPRLHAGAGSGEIRRGAARRSCGRATAIREERIRRMFGNGEMDIQFPTLHPGPSHLPDRVCGRRRQA